MVNILRGDVILCDLNPVIGSEQRGIRPCIVIQNNQANLSSPHTIIAPFTTKIREKILPSHVFVPALVGGLSENSVIFIEQLRVIDTRRIISKMGSLEESYLSEIIIALKNLFEI